MTTDVWFRNPHSYIRELVECDAKKIVWDRGSLIKRKIDPYKQASLYFGSFGGWELLLIGPQGSALLKPGNNIDNPAAVYPTWVYGEDDLAILEELVTVPVGQDLSICEDKTVPADQRPVYGQDHVIVITEMPNLGTGIAKKFARYLMELQEEYTQVKFHIHGLYGFASAFGLGFGSVDLDVRAAAQKGRIHLPMGREIEWEWSIKHAQWVTMLGYQPGELSDPKKRCMYNIKSAIWAGQYYMDNVRIKSGYQPIIGDPDATKTALPQKQSPYPQNRLVLSGDKFHCNTCSLSDKCTYYRKGAVCSVPGAEPANLAKFFNSRDSDKIIDGLGTLLAKQANRLERGLDDEDTFGEIDPEVSKMVNSLFNNGVKLAKLVNPNLQGGTKVQVNVGNLERVKTGNANQAMAQIIKQLESQGIPREKITPKMIENLLNPDNAAIEGTVVVAVEDE